MHSLEASQWLVSHLIEHVVAISTFFGMNMFLYYLSAPLLTINENKTMNSKM